MPTRPPLPFPGAIATPAQFLAVKVRDALTPDEIVGKYFNTGFGMVGKVLHRFDQLTYACEVYTSEPSDRLFGLSLLRGCRFFDTLEQAEAIGDDAFLRGAQMGGDRE